MILKNTSIAWLKIVEKLSFSSSPISIIIFNYNKDSFLYFHTKNNNKYQISYPD